MGNRSRSWRNVLLVLLVAGLGGLLLARLARPAEPVYQGKPLSRWLEAYTTNSTAQEGYRASLAADDAVRHAGTNAFPVLIGRVAAYDQPWKLKFIRFLQRQRFIKINFTDARALNMQGIRGFWALGPPDGTVPPEGLKGYPAALAVPALSRSFDHARSLTSQRNIIYLWNWMGPAAAPAVPALLRGATNADASMRRACLDSLGNIHAEPATVVPALIQAMGDANSEVRAGAVHAAARFGAGARPAIPRLLELLKDQNVVVQREAGFALKSLDPAAAAKAGIQ